MAEQINPCPCSEDIDYQSPPPLSSVQMKCVPADKFDAIVEAAGDAVDWLTWAANDYRRICQPLSAQACEQARDRLAAALKGIE